MNICIVGCGAIGSIFGAHLALQNHITVWAYDKDQSHIDAINKTGLHITGLLECTAEVRATSDAGELPVCDIGIITTKGQFTRDAIKSTAHIFKNGVVCSLQNGVSNEEIIAEYVDTIVSGTVLLGGHLEQAGRVKADTNGITKIGPYQGKNANEHARQLVQILSTSGLDVNYHPEPRGLKWTKLIFNAAANPVCALTRLPFGNAYERLDLRELIIKLAEEGIAVAEALSIELESNPLSLLNDAAESAYNHVPSMLSDVLSGRQSEVDVLNGSIVHFANKLDIPCPANELVLKLMQGLDLSHFD